MNPSVLLTASVAIIGLLGLAHLILTLRGPKLLPRDPSLKTAMQEAAPVITSHTNIWRMWIGFNISHSMGALLFGLVYGYLALFHSEVIFGSVFLQIVGFVMLAGFVILAKLYWFITPFVASSISLLLYLIGIAMASINS